MSDWLRLGADLEEIGTRALMGTKRIGGALRPMRIRPYRGFVADGVAHVRARVLEEPRFDAGPEGLRLDATLRANLMRWVVLDMPGVRVKVSVGDHSVTVRSNDDGFVIAKVPIEDAAPGWHAVHLSTEDTGPLEAHGRVVNPDPASKIAVITDIDDTILRTGMTEGLTSIRRTLLRSAHGRRPIPGTPSLYRGLMRGTGGRPEATFFYVSSSPWNLYDMLVQFLQMRGFPRGPLFLTDWRPGPKSVGQSKESPGHKRARIRRLIDAYPELSFVLIGDSGEHDPEIYQEFLESDGDRITAALIRDVHPGGSRSEWLREQEAARRSEGKRSVLMADDVVQMADIAASMGLIDEMAVEEVQTELTGLF